MTYCGANKRSGGTCRKPAGWGVPGKPRVGRCRLHGGATPTHVRAAEVEMAREACALLSLDVAGDPAQALLDEVARTQAAIIYYETEIALLPLERGSAPVYAATRHASGKLTGEAKPHVLVALWMAERKHLADVCAKALHAGVARRQIELAEGMARQVVDVMAEFATRLGLDPAAPEVRTAGRAALQLVSGRVEGSRDAEI